MSSRCYHRWSHLLLMPDHDPLDNLPIDLADPDGRCGEIALDELELDKIPRQLWAQALAPVPAQWRFYAAQRVPDKRLRALAHRVVADLNRAEREAQQARTTSRRRAGRTAAPLPAPSATHAATRPTAQINLRLRRDDYERLHEAAMAVGMKPTTLARALVLNGVAKVLQERRAT